MGAERGLPLAGVRVLAQGIVWAGPFATVLLSDLGAEVIEVESIQHLNPTRTNFRHIPQQLLDGRVGTYYLNRDGSEGFWNRQAWFNFAKRGCKSVTLNLESERGCSLFYELVQHADAFIENNAAAVVERLKLDYATLTQLNPRLIMVRFPGFGIEGPYRHYKGYGTIMEAVAGHTLLRGYEGSDPSQTPNSLHGDPNAGANVAFALIAALFARERTGAGQLIDLSQSEAVLQQEAYAFMDYAMNARVQGHWGNASPAFAPYGPYPASGDDRWVAIAADSDAAFCALCACLELPGLATDARFADAAARYAHRGELDPLIAARTREHDARALMQQLQAAGVPATELLHQDEMTEDPHLRAREFFQPVAHPEAGTHLQPGPLARFARQPLVPVRGPAPTLGQHNQDVLCGLLGLSRAEYDQLVADEIIGTVYREDAHA
ncbi:MAG: CoA transferase [Chloroflexi bacterium]|nr:CoA transferase [Chloroflexota bacterium]